MCELCTRVEDRKVLVEGLRPARRLQAQVPLQPRQPEPLRESTLQILMRLAATWAV